MRRGRWVLLKVVAGEGQGAVHLAASPDATQPRVIKAMPVAPETGRIPGTAREERQILARMRFAHLAEVIASPEVEGDGGFVMEYVAGRSLAAASRRAADYSVLLPPELGLVVAHDAFAAAEFFHAFEGRGRAHGNITARTLLVSYSGEVKVAGYRPGFHPPAGIDVYATRDLKPLANILSELTFQKFPQELAVVVPRLLEDWVTPEESVAAVRAFLHEHQPSLDQRRRVAAWLADVFLGEREAEAQEEARLLAAGVQLIGPRRRVAKRVSWVGGTALLALVGGLSLLAHRQAAEPRAMANRAEPPATMVRETVVREPPLVVDRPMAELSAPAVALAPAVRRARPSPWPPRPPRPFQRPDRARPSTPPPLRRSAERPGQRPGACCARRMPRSSPANASRPSISPSRPSAPAAGSAPIWHWANTTEACFAIGKP